MASLPDLTKNANESAYWVVHPLDDLPEQKRDVSALGPMPMTPSAAWNLAPSPNSPGGPAYGSYGRTKDTAGVTEPLSIF